MRAYLAKVTSDVAPRCAAALLWAITSAGLAACGGEDANSAPDASVRDAAADAGYTPNAELDAGAVAEDQVDAAGSAADLDAGEESITLSEFCHELAAKVLQIRSDCYPLRYPEATRASALARFEERCGAAAAVLRPGVYEFVEANARACLTRPLEPCEVPRCEAFEGRVKSGPCPSTVVPATSENDRRIDGITGLNVTSSCVNGLLCANRGVALLFSDEVGTCAATYDSSRISEGQRCSSALSNCKFNLHCLEDYGRDAGAAGSICVAGSTPPGTPCSGAERCWGNSFCVNGACRGPGKTGERCTEGYCEPNAYCDLALDAGGYANARCAALRNNGEPCSRHVECGSGLCDEISATCEAPSESELPGRGLARWWTY